MKGGPKIFGIGLSKTGTNSLAQALTILGYSAVHYPWDARTREQLLSGDFRLDLLERCDAVMDNPVVPFYRSFDRLYPGSKFILTVRDLEPWLASAERHWGAKPLARRRDGRTAVRLAVFGITHFERGRFTDVWHQHNAAVREYFAGREGDFLELNICGGQGWPELCEFLGEPVPDVPFPRANVGAGAT